MHVKSPKVTKEWYRYEPFERILQELWTNGEDEWRTGFTRGRLRDVINSGRFGHSMIATYSPESGSVETIMEQHRQNGRAWFDIQNLTYHYSWQNPKGNYRSHRQLLKYLNGRGGSATYRLDETAFEKE